MDVVVSGASVIDVTTGDAIPDGAVLIRDGRIVQTGRRASVPNPGSARVIDAGGGWLLPGLINLHAHFSLDASASPVESLQAEPVVLTAIRAVGHAREALRSGVTTARELGARDGMNVELRNAIAKRYVAGPRIFACGRAITWTGGLGYEIGREADGPEEVRKAVREQVSHGADVIKLFATGGVSTPGNRPGALGLTIAEMKAAVDESHRAGIKSTAHATTTQGIRDAVEAGIDCVEHGIGLDDPTIAVMCERRIPLVSTLSVHQALFRAPAGNPLLDAYKARAAGRPAARKASFQRAVAGGVRFGAGSDSGTVLCRHDDFVTELEQMIDAGVSCIDAIRAATSWAAEILGMRDVGTLATGTYGDVIVAREDPRKNVSALRNLAWVLKEGEVVVGDAGTNE